MKSDAVIANKKNACPSNPLKLTNMKDAHERRTLCSPTSSACICTPYALKSDAVIANKKDACPSKPFKLKNMTETCLTSKHIKLTESSLNANLSPTRQRT